MALSGRKHQRELSLKSVCLSCHTHISTDKHHSQTGCVLLHQMSMLSGNKAIGYLWSKDGLQRQPSCQIWPNKVRQVASEHNLLVEYSSLFEWDGTLLVLKQLKAKITPLHSYSALQLLRNRGKPVPLEFPFLSEMSGKRLWFRRHAFVLTKLLPYYCIPRGWSFIERIPLCYSWVSFREIRESLLPPKLTLSLIIISTVSHFKCCASS